MESGTFLLASFATLAVGTAMLCSYVYGLYRLGFSLGCRFLSNGPIPLGALLLALGCIPFSAAFALLPMDAFWKAPLVLSVYIVHAQPVCIGYWGARLVNRSDEEHRWAKIADDWLAEWECRPSEEARDEPFGTL